MVPDNDTRFIQSAVTILRFMAMERRGWKRYLWGRWRISSEPLRIDAQNLLWRSLGPAWYTENVEDPNG